jgi:hypothetical protein
MKRLLVMGQFRFSRHSGESPEGIPLGPESRFVPFFNMDASFRWHDDGFHIWVSKLTHYPSSLFLDSLAISS